MGKSEIEMNGTNDLSHNVIEISEADRQLCGNVAISIGKMLKQLPHVNEESSIYRVPKQLHDMNPKAYDPQLISIGPYHHFTRKDLIATEQYKLQGLINFLRRINNNKMESLEDLLKIGTLKALVEKAHCWVKEARNCYAAHINMKEEEFVMMMLVDACFIVEFFILYYDQGHPDCRFSQIQHNVDLSFYKGIVFHIFYDLTKLENQVPFFLLRSLFHLIPEDDVPMISFIDDEDGPISFTQLTYNVLNFGFMGKYEICCELLEEPAHLVDFLIYFLFVPLPPGMKNRQHEKSNENNNDFSSLLRFLLPAHWKKQNEDQNSEKKKNKKPHDENNMEKQWVPPSITELCEAGVTIKKAENTKCLMNISFKNGVLEIPPLFITDSFEIIMRNLIAFEHFSTESKNKYVIQYVSFLDYLICSDKDVSLLVKADIIINDIGGSDIEVSQLFNNLCKFVAVPSYSSHFNNISKDLVEHYNGWWNKSKASLKHNYFNTPWAFISFFAATLLIILTLLQTIFSAISAFPT
ncbi:UPF0481 protein At3g47200-like [Benincasa hispida]|uniref:UPF0481 protein At3g47200-like n=1 Tax=Benincasa hispida TaxID=102211 RepID=UPI0019000DD9|nr:UPF0481 protein At3g47200-like [Benincasa hispida]